MAEPDPSEALDPLPDLRLGEHGHRWGVSSLNSAKARAAALGVELRRESSTRTVCPTEHLALGDELAEHLQKGGTLASFGRSLTAAADGTDGPGSDGPGSSPPGRSPVVPRTPQESAELGAWLDTSELALLIEMAPESVRGCGTGHGPRFGHKIRQSENVTRVWWEMAGL